MFLSDRQHFWKYILLSTREALLNLNLVLLILFFFINLVSFLHILWPNCAMIPGRKVHFSTMWKNIKDLGTRWDCPLALIIYNLYSLKIYFLPSRSFPIIMYCFLAFPVVYLSHHWSVGKQSSRPKQEDIEVLHISFLKFSSTFVHKPVGFYFVCNCNQWGYREICDSFPQLQVWNTVLLGQQPSVFP